ncbi:MAG TPA: DUF5947 family protein [Candidatus Udaeobacter sp.]|jgi:hypothetical protein
MPSPSLEALRKFARVSRDDGPAQLERCELCSISVPPHHRHLVEVAARKIVCACDPCALRFQNAINGRFKLIPRDTRSLSDFQITEAEWEALALPINLAFFFYSSSAQRTVAMYPSPAGATESLLPLTAWDALVTGNPILRELQPDVEALLVNRVGDKRAYFIAPIDTCFELVGTIRTNWRGLSGGEEVWSKIDNFFCRLANA